MKITSYTIEVLQNGQTLYLREGNVISYTSLDNATTTEDFSRLGQWENYVRNDLDQNSITYYQIVEIELKASTANVDGEIHDSLETDALNKLTSLDKEVLGL